jgi:hypothetical protein
MSGDSLSGVTQWNRAALVSVTHREGYTSRRSVAGLELLVCLINRQPRSVAAVVLGSLPVIVDYIGLISLMESSSHIDLTLKCIGTHSPTPSHCRMRVRANQRPSGLGLS